MLSSSFSIMQLETMIVNTDNYNWAVVVNGTDTAVRAVMIKIIIIAASECAAITTQS